MGLRSGWISWIAVVALLCGGAFAQATDPDARDLSQDPAARGIADLLFAQGMIDFQRGDPAAALALFERAASTRRDDATYRYFAALAKLRLGRLDEAVFQLQSTLPPADNRVVEARVRFDLADCYYRKGYFTAARRELKRALALDAGDGWAHFYLGLVMLAQGETTEAIDAFDVGVQLAPELKHDGAYYLGIAAFERGRLEESRSYFEQVLRVPFVPSETEASSREWLGFLDEVQRPGGLPRGDIRVALGVEHDSNPDHVNQDFVNTSSPSDFGSALRVRVAYRPLIARGGWTVGAVIRGRGLRHEDASTGDTTSAQGRLHAAWGVDPLGYASGPLGYARVPEGMRRFGVLLQAAASHFDRDGQSFRRDEEVAATLLIYQPGFGKTQFEIGHDDATLLDVRNRGHSGSSTLFRLGQYFYFNGRPERYVRLSLGLTDHAPEIAELRRDATRFDAELALPLGQRWNLFLLTSLGRDEYDAASSSFYSIAVPREDELTELAGKLTLDLHRSGFISFRYGWFDRSVDALSALSFDREVATADYTFYW
jgi:Tfp pilus assembly protein PilF